MVDVGVLGCATAGGAGGVVELVSHAEGAVAVGRGEEEGEGEAVRCGLELSWSIRYAKAQLGGQLTEYV